jgi:redox-sensitive bicupin YhaK (pirin superfamily)
MQYTCAGSGITHSETNTSAEVPLRFVQIWIQPNALGLPPRYVSNHFTKKDRLNRLLQIASGEKLDGLIQVNQDTNIYVSEIQAGREVRAELSPLHYFYLVCLEGSLGIKVWDETLLELKAFKDAHSIIVETPSGKNRRQ